MALKINCSSCVHKTFTMRFTVHFALSFVLCVFSSFTTHKPSLNSVQGACTKCSLKSALVVPLVSLTLTFVFWVRSPFTTHFIRQALIKSCSGCMHSTFTQECTHHSRRKVEGLKNSLLPISHFFFYFKLVCQYHPYKWLFNLSMIISWRTNLYCR